MELNKYKDNFWQAVRGICMLAVILIHCPSGLSYDAWSAQYTTQFILRQIINFPVSVFFFLAGYFTNVTKCENVPKSYIINRGGRLLIPFILWSIFYSLIDIIKDLIKGEQIQILSIFVKIAVGKASTPLYYIFVLMQLTLLTPWLISIIKKGGVVHKLLYLVTPVSIAFLYWYNLTYGENPYLYGHFFNDWLLFYLVGLDIKVNNEKVNAHNRKNLIKSDVKCGPSGTFWGRMIAYFGRTYVVLIALIISIIEALILYRIGYTSITSQLKFGSYLYSLTLIMLLLNMSEKGVRYKGTIYSFLILFGDCSYGIYYVHIFVLMLLNKCFEIIGIDKLWGVHLTLDWVLASIISLVMVLLCNMIFKKNAVWQRFLGWIGFAI